MANNGGITDPSEAVSEQLLPHVHLVSNHQFPRKSRVELKEVVDWLLAAPKIAREAAPFYWTYLECPPDGTIALVWQPTSRRSTDFPTDGYVWAGPESYWPQELPGLGASVEVYYQSAGYVPGSHVMAHSRRRFRLVPSPATGTPPKGGLDPFFWIVHYGPSEKKASVTGMPPQIQHLMNQRQQLLQLGQITRKEFMLSDRVNWPRIPFPPRTQSMYGPPSQNRPVPQQMAYPPQSSVGPAPRKRGGAGQARPNQMVGQGPPVIMDPYDDDEDVSHGDIFDHLSPRDISLSRYKQNHDWMDEILSSPYRVQQIMMADLNLGLKGELAPLTQNIFEAQTDDALTRAPKNAYVGRLDKGLAEEFAKRCSDKTASLQAEIEQLRVNHEKAVADFSKRSLLRIAEKDLRNSVQDTGSEFWRLEGREEANSESEDEMPAPPKNVQSREIDDILAEVEAHIGRKPVPVQLVDRIQIGGFQEPVPEPEFVEPPPVEQAPQGMVPVPVQRSSGVNSPGSAGMAGDSDVDMDGTAAGMMDQMQTFPTSASVTNAPTPQPALGENTTTTQPPASAPRSEDVAMDDAGTHKENDADWVVVPKGGMSPGVAAGSATTASAPAPAVPASTKSESKPPSAAPTPGEALAFDSNDFSSLGDLDSAGEALAGYENANAGEDLGELNMEMEDSAFGDAFHAVDQSSLGDDAM